MNGRNISSVSFSVPSNSANTTASFSVMAGTGSTFTPWSYPSKTSSGLSWTKPDRIFNSTTDSNAIAPNFTRPVDPWGLAGSPIIDDNPEPDYQENEFSDNFDPTTTTVETSEATAEEATELAIPEGIAEASASATPWGLAALVNQQLGQATSQAITSGLQNTVNSNYAQNLNQHGLNVGLNADIIRSQQENTIRNQEVGGTIGSFFGPIGALIGHAVAGYANANPNVLDTAGSFQGWINPQQSNIVASQSTAGDPGVETQQDDVDTSTTS